jgi:DeoR family transcriptional regulator, aga operon transcriptional repressor
MRTGQRRREILRQLFLTGYVEAKALALSLDADPSTIRRDLEALARDGHLQRTHGGARARAGAVDVPYVEKQHARTAAKDAIAALAATLVRDGDSVLLDSGSTTHQLAVALGAHRDLTIATNDLQIGRLVADYPDVRLLLTGGELLSSTYTLVGARALGLIEDLRVDWAFLGADAIDLHAGITNTNTLEIALKRAMIAAARSAVVLADSTKFGRRALVRVAALDEVDLVLTDDELAPAVAAEYGERIRLAPPATEGARPPAPRVPEPSRAIAVGDGS